MIINHNIAALNTYRQFNKAGNAQSKAMEKLSSGQQINKAGDDAAGLAISEKMRGQIRGLEMAAQNSQDGISYIQTAEGALQETHNILQRMRELAVQSANDTNTPEDRNEIQKEINQLTSEINKIGMQTQFNTQDILRGTKATIVGEVNYGNTTLENLSIDIDSTLKSGSYKIKVNETNHIEPEATNLTNAVNVVIDPSSNIQTGDYKVQTDFNYVEEAINKTAHTGVSIKYDGEELDELVAGGYTLNMSYEEVIATWDDLADLDGNYNNVYDDGETITSYSYNVTLSISNGSNDYSSAREIKFTNLTRNASVDTLNLNVNPIDYPGFSASGNIQIKIDDPANPSNVTFDYTNLKVDNFTLSGSTDAFALGSTGGSMGFDIDGVGWRSRILTSDDSDKIPLADGSGDKITSEWIDISNPVYSKDGNYINMGPDSQTDPNFHGIKLYIKDEEDRVDDTADDGSFIGGTTTKFTVIQRNTASLVNVEDESTVIESTAIDKGDSGVTFKNHFELVKFDVKDEDIIFGEVEFDLYNPDEYFADMQIGANEGQSMNIAITDMRANILGVSSYYAGDNTTRDGLTAHYTKTDDVEFRKDVDWNEYALDFSTHDKATANIKVLDSAINKVSSERSRMGAFQNRLEHTINNLNTSSENLTAAESRIRDVDMAKEMMEQTKASILSQASQAMLSQANQMPQGVLQLLR